MRKSSPWLRSYRDALHNPKIIRLSDRQFRIWQCCLWIADDDGRLPPIADLACHLRLSMPDAEQVICDLVEAQLVDVLGVENGIRKLSMHDWGTHQYASDNSSERTRKYRKSKNKKDGDGRVTVKRRHSDADVTPPDTDTDTELDANASGENAKAENGKTAICGSAKSKPGRLEALQAFESYNQTATRCGLPQAAKLTPDRERKIIARLRDYGPDGWTQALANIEKSKFLCEGSADRDWRASLDWMLKASSFAKLHDGGYGNGRYAKQVSRFAEYLDGPRMELAE